MEEEKQNRIKDALQFIEKIFALAEKAKQEYLPEYSFLLALADNYIKKRKEVKKKYPYHVNPIEELHANENANSRILCAMLRYQVDGEYKILKSFVNRFFPDFQIEIGLKPTIETEQYRIDLSIREKNKYALIVENKIHDAGLQKNQLAKYIEVLHNKEKFEYTQIYVIFLPSSGYYEPNDCSWHRHEKCCDNCNGDCALKDKEPELRKKFEEEGRYQKITFREDILSWLKEDVLPQLMYKETLLQASVILYIDYLEGLFNLRTIDEDMNMELKEFIINELKLNQKDFINKLYCLNQKKKNLEELRNQLDTLHDELILSEKEFTIKHIDSICKRIVNFDKYKSFEYKISTDRKDRLFSLGFKEKDWDMYIVFEAMYPSANLFIYIGILDEKDISNQFNKNDRFAIQTWRTTEWAAHPYGWKWLYDEEDFIKLYKAIEDNNGESFENLIKEELHKVLTEIENHPNEIKMTF